MSAYVEQPIIGKGEHLRKRRLAFSTPLPPDVCIKQLVKHRYTASPGFQSNIAEVWAIDEDTAAFRLKKASNGLGLRIEGSLVRRPDGQTNVQARPVLSTASFIVYYTVFVLMGICIGRLAFQLVPNNLLIEIGGMISAVGLMAALGYYNLGYAARKLFAAAEEALLNEDW